MDKNLERLYFVLEKVEQDECLCSLSSEELNKISCSEVIFNQWENLDYELLSINSWRKIVEVYIKNAISSSLICESISNFMQSFRDDEAWLKTVSYFKKNQDKFLMYGMSKFLAATFYTFPTNLFFSRLEVLLKDLQHNANNRSGAFDLELLSCLVEFDSSKYLDNNIYTCKKKVSCTISCSEDIFSLLCLELSKTWSTLLNTFLHPENQNICLFLNLWKHLCEKKLKEDFLQIFLNEEFAVEFLSLSLKIPAESYRLYVDIISQTFSSNLKGNIWQHSEEKKYEEAVLNALSEEFFHLFSLKNETSSFSSSLDRNPNSMDKGNIKFDVTSKKVVFIILNLLAEFRNSLLLCEALGKIFDFFEKHIKNWKPQSTYLWIVDTFIEEDDLLFGVMLASLKIYCTLKNSHARCENNNPAREEFIKEIDPHKIFINFFQQLGNDHNELLSFLLSDETCCLLYLLQYLKLLLIEWRPFIDAHRILIDASISAFLPTDSSPVQFNKSHKLVSYSSSSSSDEECLDTTESHSTKDLKSFEELALRTVSALINLKIAIQKLVDMNEFPYNILPLINLLKTCEKEYRTLR